jgi:hypothetical protein
VLRGIAIRLFALMDEFGFPCAEEALHRRIVPVISVAAHRLNDRGGLQDLAVVTGGVLTAAIRMMAQARPGMPPLDGHRQGGHGAFGAHVLAHRPAGPLAGEQVEDHGQVELTPTAREGDWRKGISRAVIGDSGKAGVLREGALPAVFGLRADWDAKRVRGQPGRLQMPTGHVGCWRFRRHTKARIGAMARKTLCDWVHCFNAAGPEG